MLEQSCVWCHVDARPSRGRFAGGPTLVVHPSQACHWATDNRPALPRAVRLAMHGCAFVSLRPDFDRAKKEDDREGSSAQDKRQDKEKSGFFRSLVAISSAVCLAGPGRVGYLIAVMFELSAAQGIH